MKLKGILRFLIFLMITANPAMALEPGEILVISNLNVSAGIKLAMYYMEKRNIPANHLVKLQIKTSESCNRLDYITKVAVPVRNYIKKLDAKGEHIRCLVIMYGMPLRIIANKQLPAPKTDKNASLDSEIALILCEEDYPVTGWIPNPYFVDFQNRELEIGKEKVLMVSRLDGTTEHIVRRIIDDSILAEQTGLTGKAYFDARWKFPGTKKLEGYAFYDRSIHFAAKYIQTKHVMPVILENSGNLFKKNECPSAALYCGWYSLGNYVDSFQWMKGAIGYHIASSECATLKKKSSRVWCKMMLEKGIAATIGPVEEPYIQAFPLPEIFFKFLTLGHLTLAESYMVSIPYLSWKMVLIGDPLYSPFKKY